MKANYLLINHFIDCGTLRYYAAWLYFKKVFVNGCFYKNTNIASRVGISRNTANKYIKFFLDNGWASYHKGNFKLSSKPTLKKLYNISLINDHSLKKYNSITEVLNSLRYIVLQVKFNQFQYIQKNYRDLVNPKNLKAYKAAKRKNISFNCLQDESKQIALSYVKIAQLLKVSKAKAVQIIQQFKNSIKKIKGRLKYQTGFYYLSSDGLAHNQFLINGKLFTVTPNKYEFL